MGDSQRIVPIDSNRSTSSRFPVRRFDFARDDSVRMESNHKYLTRINSSLSSRLKNEKRSCIIISRVVRVESLSTSRESTQVCSHVLTDEKRSCITISRVLTSGGADRLSANRVESSSASDESTLVGCIGHVWREEGYLRPSIRRNPKSLRLWKICTTMMPNISNISIFKLPSSRQLKRNRWISGSLLYSASSNNC